MSDAEWAEVQTTVHLWDWGIDTVHTVNINDPEIRELILSSRLVVLDEATRAKLPPPRPAVMAGDCGCGH